MDIRLLLNIGFWLATTLYGGSLMAFALLLAARSRVADGQPQHVVRVWRAWGPGLGLSMGALILFGVSGYWLDHGAFVWPLDTTPQVLTAVAHGLFLVLWASSFHLEIWTLDPTRKLDVDGQITDPAAYEACTGRVTRQAWLNAALFVAIGVLLQLAG